jgi:hypothetical protein
MTIRIDIKPDVRGKYVVSVSDPGQPDDDILLSSTSQGYENTTNPANMVRRLFSPRAYVGSGGAGSGGIQGVGGEGGGNAAAGYPSGTGTIQPDADTIGGGAASGIRQVGGHAGEGAPGMAGSGGQYGAPVYEAVELWITHTDGVVVGPERLR